MKYLTIDIEGDISSKLCREYFTKENLWRDPDTITWLCSFASDEDKILTFGTLLPSRPREFLSPVDNQIHNTVWGYHNQSNKFPNSLDFIDCGRYEVDYTIFLKNIASVLNSAYKNNVPVYYKGFKCGNQIDHYDYNQIKNLMDKYNIDCHYEVMIDIFDKIHNFWMPNTFPQKKQHTDNQSYMLNAIKHNREDATLLANTIKNRI